MHTTTLERNEDAFYLSGTARHVEDEDVRGRLGQQFADERARFAVEAPGPDQHLFELLIDSAMLTRTTGHGDPAPQQTVWHAR